MRLIDADTFWKKLTSKCEEDWADLMVVYELLEEMPSAQPEQQWIPVSERLPEDDSEVLIQSEQFFGGSLLAVAQYRSGKWEWRDDMSTSAEAEPVAWMPLPEPYREEV